MIVNLVADLARKICKRESHIDARNHVQREYAMKIYLRGREGSQRTDGKSVNVVVRSMHYDNACRDLITLNM